MLKRFKCDLKVEKYVFEDAGLHMYVMLFTEYLSPDLYIGIVHLSLDLGLTHGLLRGLPRLSRNQLLQLLHTMCFETCPFLKFEREWKELPSL